MTTLPIPDRAHERGVSVACSAMRLRTALTGFSTPESIRRAQQEIKRMEDVLRELKPQLREVLKGAG